MSQNNRPHNFEHPHSLGSFRNWFYLLMDSDGIDREFILRVFFVSLSTLFSSPLRLYESLRFSRMLKNVSIHPSPIFILGHWRTGTTHLHNLLCQDKNMTWISTFQCLAPEFYLSGDKIIKPILAKVLKKLHPTRLIDNIPLLLDAPQEGDFAIANMSPYSFLHMYTFPRQAPILFSRYAFFEGLNKQTLNKWKRVYLSVLRKSTYRSGGKRLVLKDPVNSGRIRTLLSIFPDAKFIHIYRNPYTVFLSMMWVYQTVLPRAQVQKIEMEQIEDLILKFYALLNQKYLSDKDLIPSRNLVEVRFENLEAAPLEQIRVVYERLNIPGYGQAEQDIKAYLMSISGYKKNQYNLTSDIIAKVNHHWGFAFEAWDYPLKDAGSTAASAAPGSGHSVLS